MGQARDAADDHHAKHQCGAGEQPDGNRTGAIAFRTLDPVAPYSGHKTDARFIHRGSPRTSSQADYTGVASSREVLAEKPRPSVGKSLMRIK
jgi:hypothetical protein